MDPKPVMAVITVQQRPSSGFMWSSRTWSMNIMFSVWCHGRGKISDFLSLSGTVEWGFGGDWAVPIPLATRWLADSPHPIHLDYSGFTGADPGFLVRATDSLAARGPGVSWSLFITACLLGPDAFWRGFVNTRL